MYLKSRPFVSFPRFRSFPLILSIVVAFAFQKHVFENIAEGENANQMICIVDYDETMDARLADGIEDGIEAVVNRTCVYAGKILYVRLVTGAHEVLQGSLLQNAFGEPLQRLD